MQHVGGPLSNCYQYCSVNKQIRNHGGYTKVSFVDRNLGDKVDLFRCGIIGISGISTVQYWGRLQDCFPKGIAWLNLLSSLATYTLARPLERPLESVLPPLLQPSRGQRSVSTRRHAKLFWEGLQY